MKLLSRCVGQQIRFLLPLAFVLVRPNLAEAQAFTPNQLFESWGWASAHRLQIAGVELNQAELTCFMRGASLATEGKAAPYDLQKAHFGVEKLARDRQAKIFLRIKQTNVAKAESFLREVAKNPAVTSLPDGLLFQVLTPGNGPYPRPGQSVTIHSIARLIDGTEFAQVGPYDLVLVEQRMNRGLFEGLQKINRGGRLKLFLPAKFTEGDEEKMGIPLGSAAIYEIDMVEIKETSPQDLANSLLPLAPELQPPASTFNEKQLVEDWGWTIVQQLGAAKLGLSSEEKASFLVGLANGVRGKALPYEADKIFPAATHAIASRREELLRVAKQKRIEQMNALFEELKKNPQVVTLPDGLRYEIVAPGKGAYPRPGQIVLVDYTARLLDGTIFDRTDNEPLHIEVGSVIPGWNEGIQKVNKGGRIRLYLPPSLAYGEENASGVLSSIPGGSAVIYEINLLEIDDAPK